jgi:putative ABC transport system substrate-binding protein
MVGLLLLMGWCACGPLFSSPPLVGVIQWNQELQSYEEILQGVVEGLREEGFQDGLNLRLRVVQATGDRGRAAAAVEEFLTSGAALLITLGAVPTQVAQELIRQRALPMIYLTAGLSGEAEPKSESKSGTPTTTGISLEVPAKEQLSYFQLAKPDLAKLGILYCSATPEAEATGRAAAAAGQELGLTVITMTIPDERRELLEQALRELLQEGVQGLFLPMDPVLATPRHFQIIAAATLKAGVPVMAPFPSLVGMGALLSYHVDLADTGRQAGQLAARLLLGNRGGKEMSFSPSLRKRLCVNMAVAQRLGLSFSRHLLSRAYEIY